MIISTFSNGNYEARIEESFDHMYVVTYFINNKPIKKTTHLNLELAECVAEDFILDGESQVQLLSE